MFLVHTHINDSIWYTVCLKANTRRRYFTNTGGGITVSGEDNNLIQSQRFKVKFALGKIKICEI